MIALVEYRRQIVIGLAVLIIAVISYYTFKKIIEPSVEKVPLPDDQANGVLNETEAATANNLAVLLYEDMDGWFDARDNELYQSYAIVSDRMFVAVYNEFNRLYSSKGYGTLRSWLNDESYTAFTGNLVKNTIFPRMDKLGLV